MKRIAFVVLFLLTAATAGAQWRLGIIGGAVNNWHNQDQIYAYDRKLSPRWGATAGLSAQYDLLSWLGVRIDLQMMQRGYQMNAYVKNQSYTFTDKYHFLPVFASFSFGGRQLRSYADVGGYVGHWTCGKYDYSINSFCEDGKYITGTEEYAFDSRRDRRFDAGLAGHLGIKYTFPKVPICLSAEAVCYYGLVSRHKDSSSYFSQPAYDTDLGIQIGVAYVFKSKKQNEL